MFQYKVGNGAAPTINLNTTLNRCEKLAGVYSIHDLNSLRPHLNVAEWFSSPWHIPNVSQQCLVQVKPLLQLVAFNGVGLTTLWKSIPER